MMPHTIFRRLLVRPKNKANLTEGVYTTDCKSCDGKNVGETKRLLKTRVWEFRDEVEKIGDGMPFTREQKGPRNRKIQSSHIGSHGQREPYDG